MPRPGQAPEDDDGASAVATSSISISAGFRRANNQQWTAAAADDDADSISIPPPPPGAFLGTQRLRLDVVQLERHETLVSFAPGTFSSSRHLYDHDDHDDHGDAADDDHHDNMTVAETIHTTASGTQRSLGPRDLLSLESGKSAVVSSSRRHRNSSSHHMDDAQGQAVLVAAKRVAPIAKEDEAFFEERSMALRLALNPTSSSSHSTATSTVKLNFNCNKEVGVLGAAWRSALRQCMLKTLDPVNGLQLGRALQLQLFFLTAYEAFILDRVIQALDVVSSPVDGDNNNNKNNNTQLQDALQLAFANRNVSRILLQTMQSSSRYDWLWHTHTAIRRNRLFDATSQFPLLGFIFGFAATENFPSTRNHALRSIFRIVLGQGNWITRVLTQGHESLITDDFNNTAQNLAAESNGFEFANRNQYGTHIGRIKTNEFRRNHRLPTDESLVRTFIAQPAATMVNNGVFHVLRQLAKHWNNMLQQPWGNFAHQRMEQLDPFETLRWHMPIVLTTLASLRGRNRWDAVTLAPMIEKLQVLRPAHNTATARQLIAHLKTDIVMPVCGGIPTLMEPFLEWLDAMDRACLAIEKVATTIFQMVSSVELGIRLGYDLVSNLDWQVPSDAALKRAIREHITDFVGKPRPDIPASRIASALLLTTPRDKRTLMELFQKGYGHTEPAQLLLGRVKTLLQRELRRHRLNNAIQDVSVGALLEFRDLVRDDWYWVEERGRDRAVYIYAGMKRRGKEHVFIHVNSGLERVVELSPTAVKISTYVPVAEAISRAQRVLMNIELEYGRTFKYSAFMEFSFLRLQLRRLLVVSQMNCEVLDDARLNVLREIQRSDQARVQPEEMEAGKMYYEYDTQTGKYNPFTCERQCQKGDAMYERLQSKRLVSVPPQSLLVIGGGPTGLMTVIHCTENVLATGGEVKLYEARDAFSKGGSTFERAQIVRLDSRWIEMMRYHLGTTFEDIYIPASGETDSQLGNTLPTQGFVEITIKDLENMLQIEISRLWSKGLIAVHTDAKSNYDPETNSLTKLGANLKKGDLVLHDVDPEGNHSDTKFTWRVADIKFTESLRSSDLTLGEEYGVFLRPLDSVVPFKLVGIHLDSNVYSFRSLRAGVDNFECHASNLPSIYHKGANNEVHSGVHTIVLECIVPRSSRGFVQDEIPIEKIKKKKFTIDIGETHVVESIGKPHGSKVHMAMTTEEPYGVCCIQGLKVSMGMHNFGEKRFGNGLLDDIRSINDQNTRIIGDFTKMVRAAPIVERMFNLISRDENWQHHFHTIVADSSFPELSHSDHIIPTIIKACRQLATMAPKFRRKTLQTRFFETGDNYYLGMEFPREYDDWKNNLGDTLVSPLVRMADSSMEAGISRMRETLMHHIDRLWYDGCLETIRQGDVYNSGARKRVPRLYLINSYLGCELGSLPVGESFRVNASPKEKYEVVVKTRTEIVVRNVEGIVTTMNSSTVVNLEGNLSRSPDGNTESKVALATFPVAHYVNYRTARVLNEEKGYLITFAGDEQATPHFMRYSGLTGACINAMTMNHFLKKAIDGVSFLDRFRELSEETNWSNGEVVQRGTGANYGIDGFLRPGFPYGKIVEYLESKVIEYEESRQDPSNILSHDWKVKLAAALIPRGLEMNPDFCTALRVQLRKTLFDKFVNLVRAEQPGLVLEYRSLRDSVDMQGMSDVYWDEAAKLGTGGSVGFQITVASRINVLFEQVIDFASSAFLDNKRISSELENQPKPVDSVVDDFAVEAQNFANSLTMSAAFGAGTLAFSLIGSRYGDIASAILGAFNIMISFGTMTNVARYKIRNEEARLIFWNEKLAKIKKAVFSLMRKDDQNSIPGGQNPFVACLQQAVGRFRRDLAYYNFEEPVEFNSRFSTLLSRATDPFEVKAFQVMINSKFMAETYYVNSYVQESLVNVVKALDELYYSLAEPRGGEQYGLEPSALFYRLSNFEPKLKDSLQDGPVRWGFVKQRRFVHWDVMVFVRWVYSRFWCASARGNIFSAPIKVETLGIVKQARQISRRGNGTVLRRETRDLEQLYWATSESDIASLIFLTGFLVFVASILFTFARIFQFLPLIEVLENVAFWALLPSTLGALLAVSHLVRKCFILLNLWTIMGRKRVELYHEQKSLQIVRGVTMIQIALTAVRLLAAGAAAVALPYSFIINLEFVDVSADGFGVARLNTLIAATAIVLAVAATLWFFCVEYIIRYNLPVDLGPFVCGLFHEDIEKIRQVVTIRMTDTEPKQTQDREAWEYVAREFLHQYRFDTVFAADRYGSILQYIQAGMASSSASELKPQSTSSSEPRYEI